MDDALLVGIIEGLSDGGKRRDEFGEGHEMRFARPLFQRPTFDDSIAI